MTKRLEKLIERFHALKFIQVRAIYHYTGYTKASVHFYFTDQRDAPEKFLVLFEELVFRCEQIGW